MSITISNSIFNRMVMTAPDQWTPAVFVGLNELASQPKAPALALKLMIMRRALDQSYKDFSEVRTELLKSNATRDEAGEPIIDEKGIPQMTKEAREKNEEQYNELCAVTFELPSKIGQADILGLKETSEGVLDLLGDLLDIG